ncbi:PEP-CTERM sorting domain-containing protein [Botrimarina mediterranea]|uniref:PEP-CTERM protein-sorting domain-containing protein n=1 Tax=Botrimarina mediterranea TaxID=2528022 RepID=A0A518KE72_9BACT|nr:PEP-CTERM sorting domain-containing protein [Botrimarina mediterranea]QDV76088.1 hypothetical protein Spa11_43130 [Botrimarina mediterranea]QDV80685.1 hypothetical protein K2D_43150 [Planctomycetes bacterium K2D]
MRTPIKVTALLVLAALSPTGRSQAQNTWTGGLGNWNDGANWSLGTPIDGDTVNIDNGGTAQVDALILPFFQDLDLATTPSATGRLEVLPGGNLVSSRVRIGNQGVASASVAGGLLITGNGSIYVGSSEQSTIGLTGNGELTVGQGGAIVSADDIQVASQGTAVLNLQTGGYGLGGYSVVGKFGTGVWNQSGGLYVAANDFEIGDGGRPNQAGTPGPREGTINLSGGTIFARDRMAISNRIGTGEVNIRGGGLAITGDADNEIGDGRENSLDIGRGADWTAADVLANGVSGNTSTFRVVGDQSVIAVGLDVTMDVKNVMESSNLVATVTGPSHTPILAGRNALIKNGNFLVELDGYSPVLGDEWSIIQTNVDLTDALLAFDAIAAAEDITTYDRNGVEAAYGDIVTHNNNAFTNNASDPNYLGVDGPFKSLDFSAAPLSPGLEFEVEYFQDEVLLKVVAASTGLAGDFNNDGFVNAADYTVWRDNENTSNDLGGNGDETGSSAGVVDAADYQLWRNSYGSSVAMSAAVIPEPTTLVATLAGLAACATAKRRR